MDINGSYSQMMKDITQDQSCLFNLDVLNIFVLF